MKKVMMIAAFAAALVSCQSKGTQNNDAVAVDEGVMAVAGNDSSAVAVYEGILPAADGPGIQYVLSVDSVGPDGESGYTLVTTYLDAEGPGKNKSFTSKGKKEVIQKDVNNKKKTTLKKTVYLQYLGKEIDQQDIEEKVKSIWTATMGKKVSEMKSLTLYLKPEENKAYYVINDEITGSVEI